MNGTESLLTRYYFRIANRACDVKQRQKTAPDYKRAVFIVSKVLWLGLLQWAGNRNPAPPLALPV